MGPDFRKTLEDMGKTGDLTGMSLVALSWLGSGLVHTVVARLALWVQEVVPPCMYHTV